MKKTITLLFALVTFTCTQAQVTVQCDSVLQTSTCAGGNVIVPFTCSSNFNFGNTFTAQLSDMWGSFANPVNIGSIPWFTSGVIFATIPANTNFGFLYRIRVIATNPVDTSNNSPNTILITQVAQLNTILSNPGDTACTGDTITLYAVNPAASYSWSTGDTTQSIQVTQSGIYTVTTTDFLTCQSTTSDTVYIASCAGILESNTAQSLDLYPNPAEKELTLNWHFAPGEVALTLYNALGEKCLAQKLENYTETVNRVSLASLRSGMYFLVAETADQRIVQKLVIR